MKITQSDGSVVEGTAEEVAEFLRKFDGEKVAKAIVAETPKFKKGDKVRIIGNGSQGITHVLGDGEVGEITEHTAEYSGRPVKEAYKTSFPFHRQTVAVEDLELVKNQTRAEVVAKAKRDVADLEARGEDGDQLGGPVGNNTYQNKFYTVGFQVNREKRAVTALVYAKVGARLLEKGLARCEATDVFNESIGKAIALHRALGLDVPAVYTDAPKPEGVRVGDVVNGGAGAYYTKEKRFTLTGNRGFDSFHYAEGGSDWIYDHQIGVVIDDSDRAEYQ